MGDCGGLITFSRVTVAAGKVAQVVGTDNNRTSVTVTADPDNIGPMTLLSGLSQPLSQGWPLLPGAGYVFGGSAVPHGARAAVYVGGAGTLFVATESA